MKVSISKSNAPYFKGVEWLKALAKMLTALNVNATMLGSVLLLEGDQTELKAVVEMVHVLAPFPVNEMWE